MAMSLPQFAEFDTSEDATCGERWETWLESLEYLLIGLDLKEIEPDPSKTKKKPTIKEFSKENVLYSFPMMAKMCRNCSAVFQQRRKVAQKITQLQ